jgi:hypothetical protein
MNGRTLIGIGLSAKILARAAFNTVARLGWWTMIVAIVAILEQPT